MRLATVVTASLAMAGGAAARPGFQDTIEKIKVSRASGAAPGILIGDLAELPDGKLTITGRNIKDLLRGNAIAQNPIEAYVILPPKDSAACAKDTCCIWKYIADDMHSLMVGSAGRCNNLARQAVRFGFHDAGAWSLLSGKGGGADGSIVLADECGTRFENKGMEEICAQMRIWFNKYKSYGISMADLIQIGSAVGTVSCPLGPRVRSFVGRKDSATPAPTHNLPSPFATADSIIEMFGNKTISPAGIVALLGAHSTSQQTQVFPNVTGAPQDSTPGVWDSLYYKETLDPNSPARVVKFPSDINIANDPRTKDTWNDFRDDIFGQLRWNEAYAKEAIRLSLLGVYNINDMTECTKSLPSVIDHFVNPDGDELEKYLNGGLDHAVAPLQNGDKIPANI